MGVILKESKKNPLLWARDSLGGILRDNSGEGSCESKIVSRQWGDTLGIRKGGGGGQNVSCDFGGGKRTIKHPIQNQFWRPQKVGFVWSVPVSSKENDIAWTKGGGGNRIISGGGGPKPLLGWDLWYVPPPPWVFPPLCFSLNKMFCRAFWECLKF